MRAVLKALLLSTLLLLAMANLATAAEKRVALVIGNSNYRFVPSLANPANDARLMAGTLSELGFTLVGDGALVDLDKAAMDDALRGFGTQLQGADVGLFYYAGHGLQVRGTNYLVPTGANPVRETDVDFELDSLSLVLRQMEDSGARLNLVMLDACRSNSFGDRGLRAMDAGLAQEHAPEGTLISFATQPGNVAQDGAVGDSPYSEAVAQTIRQPGLGVFDVFNRVGVVVKKATGGEQQPWLSSSPIDGTFYFAGPAPAAQASLTASAPANGGPIERTKPAQQATVLPLRPSSTAEPQVEESQIEHDVEIYDGRWISEASGSCTKPTRTPISIRNGVISGPDSSGSITPDGYVSGHYRVGLIRGRYWGTMSSSKSGSGGWRNDLGCSGTWMVSR
jgi:hypothetical protein